MNFLDLFTQIPKLFNWYFLLAPIKRIQLNYITLLAIVTTLAYYNDKRHSENYALLSARVDAVNNARAKEQAEYKGKMEFYTDKFYSLLHVNTQQRKEIKQIKEDQ